MGTSNQDIYDLLFGITLSRFLNIISVACSSPSLIAATNVSQSSVQWTIPRLTLSQASLTFNLTAVVDNSVPPAAGGLQAIASGWGWSIPSAARVIYNTTRRPYSVPAVISQPALIATPIAAFEVPLNWTGRRYVSSGLAIGEVFNAILRVQLPEVTTALIARLWMADPARLEILGVNVTIGRKLSCSALNSTASANVPTAGNMVVVDFGTCINRFNNALLGVNDTVLVIVTARLRDSILNLNHANLTFLTSTLVNNFTVSTTVALNCSAEITVVEPFVQGILRENQSSTTLEAYDQVRFVCYVFSLLSYFVYSRTYHSSRRGD